MSTGVTRERIGPYRLVRLLGKGGMGAVYEAIQEPIERRVAVKVLHGRYAQEAEIATRFFNEARAVNIVDHPGIVQISDYGQLPNGVAYLVMEYLKGETLTQRMKSAGGKLIPNEALRLARQIAAALAAAHDKGIIHRDLKPDNVMLIPDPDPEAMGRMRVKLLDFGIAKVAAELGDNASQTAADVVMGTPKYMSPEQCRGAANVDDKSDVYALGIMIYEMLAGRVPFTGGTGEILAKQIYDEPPALMTVAPWVTPNIADLVHRLIRKNKVERPSMRQVATELERMAVMFPTSVHQIIQLPRPTPQGPSAVTAGSQEEITGETKLPPSNPGRGGAADSNSGMQPQSTLGFSVGQSKISMRQPGRPRRWLIPAATGFIVAIAVLGALAFRQSQSDEGPRPLHTATVKPVKKRVYWSIATVPAGAEITRTVDGQRLGVTPWHGDQAVSRGTVSLTVRLKGYQDRLVQLDGSHDDRAEINLEAIPSAPPPPPPKPVIRRPTPGPAAGKPTQPTTGKPTPATPGKPTPATPGKPTPATPGKPTAPTTGKPSGPASSKPTKPNDRPKIVD